MAGHGAILTASWPADLEGRLDDREWVVLFNGPVMPNVGQSYQSDQFIARGHYNAVLLDINDQAGTNNTMRLRVLDSWDSHGAWQLAVDPAAYQVSLKGHNRILVGAVLPFVTVELTPLSSVGSPAQWVVIGVPVFAPNMMTVSVAGGPTYVNQTALPGSVTVSGSVFPAPATWTMTADSAANTLQTITRPADPSGLSHYVSAVSVVISGGSAASDIPITLKTGTTLLWKEWIGSGAASGARVSQTFPSPLKFGVSATANLVIGAGGSGIVTTGNFSGYTA